MCVERSFVILANSFPKGLEDVSKYPSLIEELLRRGWNETELKGVLRENFLRVFREVENVRLKSKLNLDSYQEGKMNCRCFTVYFWVGFFFGFSLPFMCFVLERFFCSMREGM